MHFEMTCKAQMGQVLSVCTKLVETSERSTVIIFIWSIVMHACVEDKYTYCTRYVPVWNTLNFFCSSCRELRCMQMSAAAMLIHAAVQSAMWHLAWRPQWMICLLMR